MLVSCGLGLLPTYRRPTPLSRPAARSTSSTSPGTRYPCATRYYLYRSETADPFVTEDGPYGPVPYATTNLTSFTDTMPGARTYSYRVTAVEERTGAESPPSEVVTGFSVDGPIEWQGATRVGSFLTDSTTSRLAVDYAATPPAVYHLAVGATEGHRRVGP